MVDQSHSISARCEGSGQRNPIAIIGMGCRLPGHVSSPSQLWELMLKEESGHCAVPRSRYNANAFYHPDAERPGSINSMGGYFIREDIHAFDNSFFGINNVEALSMDAQQRKLLEVVYESFENAGASLGTIRASNTGVYVGNFTNDFMIMQYKDPEYFSRYSATGSGQCVLANRISHAFDLRGPSVILDTACSSSLYALHFACLALDAHDCDSAVVASANLIQIPDQQLLAVKAGILSPDSICHTFDEAANGYGRAEAVSSLYLKRLSDAIRDGDPIRSVIRATAINANGKTPGIVQPSVTGQEAVIRAAYKRAGLLLNETDYIETHGTGTKIGDPTEVEAIARVFHHKTGNPTLVGGIKPTVGHSEGASGISSIIKLVLALEKGTIPATIGVQSINPDIKTSEWNVDIATSHRPWPKSQLPRASVNSFGFGGANSHAILEAASAHTPMQHGQHDLVNVPFIVNNGNGPSNKPHLLLVSAHTDGSLSKLIDDLANYGSIHKDSCDLRSLAYTMNCRRSRFVKRGYLLASQSSLVSDLDSNRLTTLQVGSAVKVPFAFVYTGQGSQWPGMGSELIRQYSIFSESIKRLDASLQGLNSSVRPLWSLEDTLLAQGQGSNIECAEKSQALTTAVQIALTDLLYDWGIFPNIVLGHSSGEIGATYAANHLTARQAMIAAYCRGFQVSRNQRQGAMLAAGIDQSKAHSMITELALQHSISVACVNSLESCTLSGDEDAIEKLQETLLKQEIFVRKLRTNGKAYHSHHMRDVGPAYQTMLESLWDDNKQNSPNGPKNTDSYSHNGFPVQMISTVTAGTVESSRTRLPSYWRANLESTVMFEDAVKLAVEKHKYHFIEIGPHKSLELPVTQTITALNKAKDDYPFSSVLLRDKDAVVTALSLIGSLFLFGHDEILFERLLAADSSRRPNLLTDLPTYPWDYPASPLWSEPRSVSEFRNRKYSRHDLLGSQISGGNKDTVSWRNILNINEITWLKDHCLGPSIVFPAAAYMVMAVEAICQVSRIEIHECPGVDMRNFNFLKALDFHQDSRTRMEIFTEMRQMPISCVNTSKYWWLFSVTSVDSNDGHPTRHANGLISLSENSHGLTPRCLHLNTDNMEQQATRVWYDKFTKEGLNWGPEFAVMEEVYCDRAREGQQAIAKTRLLRGSNVAPDRQTQYIIHPISIDCMLQTAFVATTGGWVKNLRAKVPVTIDHVHVSPPGMLDMSPDKLWSIDAETEQIGFGTVKVNTELYNSSNQVLLKMENVRCIAYQGSIQKEVVEQRNPLVRVAWKPDVTAFSHGPNDHFSRYLDWFIRTSNVSRFEGPKHMGRFAAALDLVAHKRPNLRILEVGGQQGTTALFTDVLRAASPLRRFRTYVKGSISANGGISGHKIIPGEGLKIGDSGTYETMISDDKFDLLILHPEADVQLSAMQECLASSFIAISATSIGITNMSGRFYTEVVQDSVKVEPVMITFVSAEEAATGSFDSYDILIVNREGLPSAIDVKIQLALEACAGKPVPVVGLSQVNASGLGSRSIVISTIEVETALLSTISEKDQSSLRIITDNASKVLWITTADLLSGTRPEFALVLGLSRALMLEQPSITFSVMDFDSASIDNDSMVPDIIHAIRQLTECKEPEFELAKKDGVFHALRWEPEDLLNAEFATKQTRQPSETILSEAGCCWLNINQPGQMDTIHFVRKDLKDLLGADRVEVEIKSVGMNAKDLYVLGAKVDTPDASCSCECAGLVVDVGANVTAFKPGDRVVAMAPGHFATYERIPEWAICKLQSDEEYTIASTIPIVFSTALYALKHKANLQRGESVLIHSAAGGVGIAAIQLAKHMGAEIFATVGNESKKAFLVKELGLEPAHVFSSRDSFFLTAIHAATEGRGVDVVLNSLTGDLLHTSLEACANFGRFIEIGKRDIIDHGNLDMAHFSRNISFMAFDLSNLYTSDKAAHHELWQRLLTDSMELMRTGIAKPCRPLEVFRASDIVPAFRHFSRSTRIGKVAVSFEDRTSRIQVVNESHETVLNPRKSYIMVGCLGGLGRSLSKWMMSRGAREFVFLGRSGADKPAAALLVKDLCEGGASVKVLRGDVGSYHDVYDAIRSATYPIGGVIQAAMGLSEALWSAMSNESWHASIRPKVQGTWNLHNALRDQGRDAQLDFFLMTSSISGTVGTATESNYCSANAFLDSFARYRNSLGLPAVAVGLGMISEVGYLHEHPDIEKLLKRKGIRSISEDELLQIVDLALTHQHSSKWRPHYDSLVSSHLLTGIEFTGLKDQRDRGFEGDNHVLKDPRASLFAAAFARSTNAADHAGPATGEGLPKELAKAMRAGNGESVPDAVRAIVRKKMANLILLPVEQLKPEQQLGDFGLDSMLAAEFRTFIFHALEVDVPFMTLLAKSTTVISLAGLITDELGARASL